MNTADGSRTQPTTNSSRDDEPFWNPADGRIYFRSNRGGSWNFWYFEPVLSMKMVATPVRPQSPGPVEMPAPTAGPDILEPPADCYAVQVVALSSRKELESFVRKHGLARMLRVELDVNGQKRYILLAGVYRSEEPHQAVAGVPRVVEALDPHARPVAGSGASRSRLVEGASSLCAEPGVA